MNSRTFIVLYHILTFLVLPIYLVVLFFRILLGKEDANRIFERFGIASKKRPNGNLVWIHAASIGESKIALTLIDGMIKRYQDMYFLITTGTVSSSRILNKSLPQNTFHQFIVIDNIVFVRNFLKHWKPNIGIFIESEIWPCLISEGAKTSKLVLLNARLNDISFKRWLYFKNIFQFIVKNFSLIIVQSTTDCNKFQALGVKNIINYGNIKLSNNKLQVNADELKTLKTHLQFMKVILASNTHYEDEQVIFEVIKPIKKLYPETFFIIILRHPERRNKVMKTLKYKDLSYTLRSISKIPDLSKDLYIVDTFEELGLFYSLAYISFIGGSFGNGGHNPLESAQFGNLIVFGPNMNNCKFTADEMVQNKCAIQVNNLQELLNVISYFISSESANEILELRTNAIKFVQDRQEVLSDYLNSIEKLLKSNSRP